MRDFEPSRFAPTQPRNSQAQQQQPESQGGASNAEIRVPGQPVTININPAATAPQTPPPQQFQNEGTNYSNWVLAFLTLGLLVASGLQWRTLSRQANAMDDQLGVMRDQVAVASGRTASRSAISRHAESAAQAGVPAARFIVDRAISEY